MISFIDGPAKGQTLMLQRAPLFLRVTEKGSDMFGNGGTWDGLDQPTDEPRSDEKLHVYHLTDKPSMVHINRGGASKGSGFYAYAAYKLFTNPPRDEVVRENREWRMWVEDWVGGLDFDGCLRKLNPFYLGDKK